MTLRGFKSFANRSKLVFEPGICMIVGPNGSGKSNIADAISWVLGEQSPKTLRGESMGDIIFRNKKEELGIAEVSLVFDNSDRMLPLEFQEVKVTRRVYSKGGSEYFINSSPCRLLDVHEIISDSGIGKGLHVIINQGQISEIAVLKPLDRKNIIDELIGISKHKIRRDRSKSKLLKIKENINRINDLTQEVRRIMDPLKTEAKKAQEYYDVSNALKKEEISLFLTYINDLNHKWDFENKAYSKYKDELEDVLKKITSAIKVKKEYEKLISSKKDEFNYWEEKLENFKSSENALDNMRALVKSQRTMFSTVYNMFDLKLYRDKGTEKSLTKKSEGKFSSAVQIFSDRIKKIEKLFNRILKKINTAAIDKAIMLDIDGDENLIRKELDDLKEMIDRYNVDSINKNKPKNLPNKDREDKIKYLCKENLDRSEQLSEILKRVFVVSKEIKKRLYPEFEKKKNSVKEELNSINKLEIDVSKLNISKSNLENSLYKINLRKEQIKEKVKDLTLRIVDEYNISVDFAFKNYKPVTDVKESSTIVNKLRNELKKIGIVNPNAILEYNKIKERFDFLWSQKQDLNESKKGLEELITKINKEIEEYFIERFEAINKNFKNYFKTLFPLGEGELQLTSDNSGGDDNIGVDLKVDIGNSKFVPLSLLSGGEKTLVSIAFLFSIFSTKPSPFYIFDEIDASLDDMNLNRFLSLVKKFSGNRQIIMITHQKKSMEIANTIYGVSMQSDSISRIIAEKLNSKE
jgi:chromosome segregation ATPase